MQGHNGAGTSHLKQYVFVDEYNRHKRLKVMRACDGCRRRKIRCDGALQNGPWPCGACTRLKLTCIPPSLDAEDDSQSSEYRQAIVNLHSVTGAQNGATTARGCHSTSQTPSSTTCSADTAPHVTPADLHSRLRPNLDTSYRSHNSLPSSAISTSYHSDLSPYAQATSAPLPSPIDDAVDVGTTVATLSEALGDLRIDLTGVGPYIANHHRALAQSPAVEEAEIHLPPHVRGDPTVKVPLEMMPPDRRVIDYFNYFFDYIHPYIPVLSKTALYQQWDHARESISPLILEAIFACVTRYLETPYESDRWLALASRHEESFKDVPRLSTIQAMILLMKAREAQPKRGYYYRSWMSVKYMTTMATDLRLNEHHDQHKTRNGCGLSVTDCIVRTRIWQTLFSLEIMVGGPQGRTDFAVELETVNFSMPQTSATFDHFEYATSRRFTYFVQAIRNIKETNVLWQTLRRLKIDWALDPEFVRHNTDLVIWLNDLPPDMQIQYPDDGSPPWNNKDHFVAYIHCYQHLVVLMHHRPQLQVLLERRDPAFKTHLDICTKSASKICRLQEALLRDFRLHGLLFMLRGINFTVYCVLTCTMLHLAAITSPDPLLNSQARMFFTRHMRILEHCMVSASPEIQVQINALREAFSVDVNKPFELKPTLGLRSPAMEVMPAPAQCQSNASWTQFEDIASSKTMSPASSYDQSSEHVSAHASGIYNTQGYSVPTDNVHHTNPISQSQMASTLEHATSHRQTQPPSPSQAEWDPSGIFNQWETAFGGQPTQPLMLGQVSPDGLVQPTSAPAIPHHQQQLPEHDINLLTMLPMEMYNTTTLPPNARAVMSEVTPTIQAVTPVMWQDAFTSAYVSGHGQKRFHEEDLEPTAYDPYGGAKRRF